MVFARSALAAILLVAVLPTVRAQAPAPTAEPARASAAAGAGTQAGDGAVPEWRRTGAYPFAARADTVRRLQFVAQAMQLREYCADARVSDDFVRAQLARFGRMTGREESCASLLEY